ncbi:MAG: hypothetical protein Q8N88_03110 [Nanoarchaeota archaeon]|nr:hypothetical protein [Nanoarchaeota archaeon]
MKECLDFFKKCPNNSLFRFLSLQSPSERERVRFYISVVRYSGGKFCPEAELAFGEYLRLGCPDKIHIDRHISVPKDSLENKAEGGK